jgi:hypothetical protein
MGTNSTTLSAAYLACNVFAINRAFYTPINNGLAVGSIIYNNSNLTSPYNGFNNWIAVSYNGYGPVVAVQVSSFGFITNKVLC